jgi:cytochrome b561
MQKTILTRLLHAGLAVAVIHQLAVSLVMQAPHPGRAPADLAYELHESVGLASLGILAAFWVWVLLRRREHAPGALFPWFSRRRRAAFLADLGDHARSLVRLRLPMPREETPLASATHGLGLCAATGMALTGGVLYAVMGPDGALGDFGRLARELHEMLANLMWAYLIGHAGIAILHEFAGHRTLERMFNPAE